MSEYLFSRKDMQPPADVPADLLAGLVFFQLWRDQQYPFKEIANGDTLWWVDQKARTIDWELRAVQLHKAAYRSRSDALDQLRRGYGLLPADLNDYTWTRRNAGYLLVWAAEVVAPLDVPLPEGFKLRRNGYTPVDDLLRSQLVGLPAVGRPAVATAPPWMNAGPIASLLPIEETRYIPLAVRQEVQARDGGRCQVCGTDVGPMHIDHIKPWSKGGSNEAANLQLLCAKHNLSKGATYEGGEPRPELSLRPLPRLLSSLNRRTPHDATDLPGLVSDAVSAGLLDDAYALTVEIIRTGEFDDEVEDGVIDALRGVEGMAERLELLEGEIPGDALRRLASSQDELVAAEAALLLLIEHGDDLSDDEVSRFGAAAQGADDPWVRGSALLYWSDRDAARERELLLLAYGVDNLDVRSAAAAYLAEIEEDDDLAYEYARQALSSSDPRKSARGLLRLVRYWVGDDLDVAEAYATELARSEDPDFAVDGTKMLQFIAGERSRP